MIDLTDQLYTGANVTRTQLVTFIWYKKPGKIPASLNNNSGFYNILLKIEKIMPLDEYLYLIQHRILGLLGEY